VRKWIALAAGVLMLLAANYTIYRREALLSGGRIVLLELAPGSGRSALIDAGRLHGAALHGG
jgi:uncharacterized membrane-anchored protein